MRWSEYTSMDGAEFLRRLAAAHRLVGAVLLAEIPFTNVAKGFAGGRRLFRTRNMGEQLLPLLTIETARALGSTDWGPVRVGAAIVALRATLSFREDASATAADFTPRTDALCPEAGLVNPEEFLRAVAFDILAHPDTTRDPAISGKLCAGLARTGLALSVVDQPEEGSGRLAGRRRRGVGALLRFSIEAGILLTSPPPTVKDALTAYGLAICAAFEVRPDGSGHSLDSRLRKSVADAKIALEAAGLANRALLAAAEFLGCGAR